jgi:glycerol-3-phosphate cytidylyltransferase
LTVALSSDEFNFSKGKEAKFSWEQRKLDLEGVRYVDDIISEDDGFSRSLQHSVELRI